MISRSQTRTWRGSGKGGSRGMANAQLVRKHLETNHCPTPHVPGRRENHAKQERTDFLGAQKRRPEKPLRNGCFSAREHPRASYCKLPTALGEDIPPGQAFSQSSTHRPPCSAPALLLLEGSPFRWAPQREIYRSSDSPLFQCHNEH